MSQINVRVGKFPFSDKYESTINGVPKPLKETWELANKMFSCGVGNPIIIDGEVYIVEKALFEEDRIIAEAHEQKEIMVKNTRDLYYLKSLLEFEKKQMEKSEVSNSFFEYESLQRWLDEIWHRIELTYPDKER